MRIQRPFGIAFVSWVFALVGGWAAPGCRAPSETYDPGEVSFTPADWQLQDLRGLHLTSPHFDVYTTSTDAELRQYLPRFLETTYRFYTALLPSDGPLDPQVRMQTYLFDNRTQWERFVKQRFPQRFATYRRIPSGGFTEGPTCVVYDIGRAETLSILAHEGFHQYVGAHCESSLPAWLNEGLAAYCESVEFRDDRPYFVPQRNTFRLDHLRDALVTGTTIPLVELLATDAGQIIDTNDTASVNAYYAQIWALMVFIRHAQEGRYASSFDALARGVRDNTLRIKAQAARVTAPRPSETSFGEAVFRAYVTDDLAAFEQTYREFLARLCWKT